MDTPVKVIDLKTLQGTDIKVSIKTLISEWDLEQVENYYLRLMKYDEETGLAKMDTSGENMPNVLRERQNAQLEVLITKVEGMEVPAGKTAEVLKQSLSRQEFRKLREAIDKVLDDEEVPEAKKKPSPKS